MPRSIARRSAGVYSSSVAGSLGTIVITPPVALNSSSCPLLKPALRRTAGGTTRGVLLLFFTATVMIGSTPDCQCCFQCRAATALRQRPAGYGERVPRRPSGSGRGIRHCSAGLFSGAIAPVRTGRICPHPFILETRYAHPFARAVSEPAARPLLPGEGGDSAGCPSFWTTATRPLGADGHEAIAEEFTGVKRRFTTVAKKDGQPAV